MSASPEVDVLEPEDELDAELEGQEPPQLTEDDLEALDSPEPDAELLAALRGTDEEFDRYVERRETLKAAPEVDEPSNAIEAMSDEEFTALERLAHGEEDSEADVRARFDQEKARREAEEFKAFIRADAEAKGIFRDDNGKFVHRSTKTVEDGEQDAGPEPNVFEKMTDEQFDQFLAARDARADSLGGATEAEMVDAYAQFTKPSEVV